METPIDRSLPHMGEPDPCPECTLLWVLILAAAVGIFLGWMQ